MRDTTTEFDLHANNMKFSTQKEERQSTRILSVFLQTSCAIKIYATDHNKEKNSKKSEVHCMGYDIAILTHFYKAIQ